MAKRPIILKEDADRTKIEEYGENVANGVEANPTDFPSPVPTPLNVKLAIKTYVDSIKAERDRSIATDENTETNRKEAIRMVNSLINFAFYKVDGNDEKLLAANIKLPKPPTPKELKKLELTTSRMGTEKGSYFFRISSKAGAGLIGVFHKNAEGQFKLTEAFDIVYLSLKDQPSGSQTYMFRGKRGKDWGPTSDEVTVWVP